MDTSGPWMPADSCCSSNVPHGLTPCARRTNAARTESGRFWCWMLDAGWNGNQPSGQLGGLTQRAGHTARVSRHVSAAAVDSLNLGGGASVGAV